MHRNDAAEHEEEEKENETKMGGANTVDGSLRRWQHLIKYTEN